MYYLGRQADIYSSMYYLGSQTSTAACTTWLPGQQYWYIYRLYNGVYRCRHSLGYGYPLQYIYIWCVQVWVWPWPRLSCTVGWSVEFFFHRQNRSTSQRSGMSLEVQIRSLDARVPVQARQSFHFQKID